MKKELAFLPGWKGFAAEEETMAKEPSEPETVESPPDFIDTFTPDIPSLVCLSITFPASEICCAEEKKRIPHKRSAEQAVIFLMMANLVKFMNFIGFGLGPQPDGSMTVRVSAFY